MTIAFLCGCSPVYVAKVAKGHAGLIWRRKSIERALKDPKVSADLKSKLEIVSAAREFAFDTMGLKRSRAYSTYTVVKGPALTYLVEACEKLRFNPYLWHFPFIGSFPYKGHFDPKDAQREADELAAKGYDTYVGGAAAYNASFLFSDPVPSTVLAYEPGELADLIIHELTHGTVFFKDQTDFNESLATFVGGQGAREFLAKRYGADSKELKEFLKSREDDARFGVEMDGLYADLQTVYQSSATAADKLMRREEIFSAGLKRLNDRGYHYKALNNAVIMGHKVYHRDLTLFEKAYRSSGRDWPKTIALLKGLDRKDPLADLRRRLLISSP